MTVCILEDFLPQTALHALIVSKNEKNTNATYEQNQIRHKSTDRTVELHCNASASLHGAANEAEFFFGGDRIEIPGFG